MTTVFVEFVRAGKEQREFASLMRRREKIPTAEIRRNAPFGGTQGAEEHRRTQGWLRQEVMLEQNIRRRAGQERPRSQCPEKHPGTQCWRRSRQDAMLPSAGGNKIAIQASPGQYHFVCMRRREEPGLGSRARLDR